MQMDLYYPASAAVFNCGKIKPIILPVGDLWIDFGTMYSFLVDILL